MFYFSAGRKIPGVIFEDNALFYCQIIMILPYCVYVLISETDRQLYIGYTTNIEERIIDHNRGHTKSTASRKPLKLVFCEQYLSKADALRREKYLKTTSGKKALKLMLRETFAEEKYPGKYTMR